MITGCGDRNQATPEARQALYDQNMKKEQDIMTRRRARAREVVIMPHSMCKGKCKYCSINKSLVRLDWKKLFENAFSVILSLDLMQPGSISIMGGELLMDEVLKDKDYEDNLKTLIKAVRMVTADTRYRMTMPVSLENIGDLGNEFLKWCHEKAPYLQINCAFTQGKFLTPEAEAKYFENMERNAEYISLVMIPNILPSDYILTRAEKYPILKKFRMIFDEPIMMDEELAYSYSTIDWYMKPEEIFADPHCNSDKEIIVTADGQYTCMGMTRQPIWIDDAEWMKLKTDREYLDKGYQQVLDWYGCDSCEKKFGCPGMCWISYYAQKNLFNNRKCIYRSKEEFEKSGLVKEGE